jgi:hypothetical protein
MLYNIAGHPFTMALTFLLLDRGRARTFKDLFVDVSIYTWLPITISTMAGDPIDGAGIHCGSLERRPKSSRFCSMESTLEASAILITIAACDGQVASIH